MSNNKVVWRGTVVSVQPRIRLTRSFDERYHTYLGYMLRLQGQIGDEQCEFLVGIGKAAHAKHQFRVVIKLAAVQRPLLIPRWSRLATTKQPA